MTAGEILEAAAELARNSGAEATPWDARILLAHAMGGSSPLSRDPRRRGEPGPQARFDALWERRLEGTPVQHLLGEWDFFGRSFTVDRRAPVPRPRTGGLGAGRAPRARSWHRERCPRDHVSPRAAGVPGDRARRFPGSANSRARQRGASRRPRAVGPGGLRLARGPGNPAVRPRALQSPLSRILRKRIIAADRLGARPGEGALRGRGRSGRDPPPLE